MPSLKLRSQVDSITSDRATSVDMLSTWVRDARARTLQLVADLDDDQMIGPKLPTVNPLQWEIAHAAWFQEHWVLQQAAGLPPIAVDGPGLFDSISIDHDVRWDLPLPTRRDTIRYVEQVRDAVLEVLDRVTLNEQLIYFVKLSVFHEDMHTEAFTYTRQTLGWPAPRWELTSPPGSVHSDEGTDPGDVELPGGRFQLGAARDGGFVFDNEKWAHDVVVEPFTISRSAVTQAQFAAFVDAGGYRHREFWTDEGWQWRLECGAEHPLYWRRDGGWIRRHFDQWLPLEPQLPVIHVNWYEADAYCRWAGRRLPTEVEWEWAAAGSSPKRHYPWDSSPPTADKANLDWQAMGTVPVTSHADGDSQAGCRQLIGNVWEWTATTFQAFPGFSPDPYQEYSRPMFGNCRVLRGGCWATRSRLIRNSWRNFYHPDRRDIFAGFRTCLPICH